MPLIIAHRGFSGRYPENTIAAVRAAIRLGVDAVEIDVQQTRDGRLIVFHDQNLRRVARRPERIGDMDWSSLRRLRLAIPTLEQVLRACRHKTRLFIEIKRADPVAVAGMIHRQRMSRQVTVMCFSAERLRCFRQCAPEIETVALIARATDTIEPGPTGVGVCQRLLRSRRDVERWRRRAGKVYVWTVNRAADLRRYADLGVDGLITNRPDRALAVVAARR